MGKIKCSNCDNRYRCLTDYKNIEKTNCFEIINPSKNNSNQIDVRWESKLSCDGMICLEAYNNNGIWDKLISKCVKADKTTILKATVLSNKYNYNFVFRVKSCY